MQQFLCILELCAPSPMQPATLAPTEALSRTITLQKYPLMLLPFHITQTNRILLSTRKKTSCHTIAGWSRHETLLVHFCYYFPDPVCLRNLLFTAWWA